MATTRMCASVTDIDIVLWKSILQHPEYGTHPYWWFQSQVPFVIGRPEAMCLYDQVKASGVVTNIFRTWRRLLLIFDGSGRRR